MIDSVQAIDKDAKIFTMGDLNDNPTNASVKKYLKAKKEKEDVAEQGIYNPFEKMFTEKVMVQRLIEMLGVYLTKL